MRRFFRVFTILLTVFLLVAGGSMAVLHFYGIRENSTVLPFVLGWGVTDIPYSCSTITYPKGDVFLVKRVAIDNISAGSVMLYMSADSPTVRPARVDARTGNQFLITTASGQVDQIQTEQAALYRRRIPKLATLLDALHSWVAVGILAAVLIASIVLWRISPRRKKTTGPGGLSPSDGEIASVLY